MCLKLCEKFTLRNPVPGVFYLEKQQGIESAGKPDALNALR